MTHAPFAGTRLAAALPRPADQKLRITLLRLLGLALLPAVAFGFSGWSAWPLRLLQTVGLAAVLLAVLGRFWAILYIGGHKNATVLQDGPYSICRHPLYLFSTIGIAGFGLMLGSVELALIFAVLGSLVLSITARHEEAFLRTQFGGAYDDYSRRVPMILPRLSGYHTRAEVSFAPATLRRNARDALVFLLAVPVAQAITLIHQQGFLLGFALR